jgi:uncharacterized protein (TIGR02145 family)
MKKAFFIPPVLALAWMGCALAQKPILQLTFDAAYYGQAVSLDSIYVENLTQGGDTTLYAPDHILVLYYSLGVGGGLNAGDNELTVYPNYPNPFADETSFRVYVPGEDRISLVVSDLRGAQVAVYEDLFPRGDHGFCFRPGEEEIYLLTVKGTTATRTLKMVCLNNRVKGHGSIVYKGMNSDLKQASSDKGASGFVFSLGDQLQYTGFAKTTSGFHASDVLIDTPYNDKTYDFSVTEGYPCSSVRALIHGGQLYTTVWIGSQCWMKQNLNIGTMILGGTTQSNNGLIEKYCYDNDLSNCAVFGGMYQWLEMMKYSTAPGAQGICPTGWHIPTDGEFAILENVMGGWEYAGGRLKETGYTHWSAPNSLATNESGFTALPTGNRDYYGNFYEKGTQNTLWTSSEVNYNEAWFRRLYYDNDDLNSDYVSKALGFSARCIKNY